MSDDTVNFVWKDISTSWNKDKGFISTAASGASVLMGKDKTGGPGLNPMEMLLAGLAGCTMMDVVDILRKKKQEPQEFKTIVRGKQQKDEYPRRFTEFQIEYIFTGENLIEKDIEQAIRLSEEKYCSVGGTLSKSGPVSSTYRIEKIRIAIK